MRQEFTIQGELCDLNTYINKERANRFIGAKIKKEQTEICRWACNNLKPTDNIHIMFKWYCKNKRKDKDNVAYAKKFAIDGMVKAGIIPNDGWNNIKGFTDEFYIDKENPRIEVIIED